jgi:soluble cytochrome b562
MKPYDLVGVDGNAFSVMGYVSRAMLQSGFTTKERDEYLADAQSDDYKHLLAVSVDMVEKVNEKLRQEGKLDEEEEW